MKILIAYSSITGNTKKVAESIFETLEGEKEIQWLDKNPEIDLEEFDRVIVGFWVDKGSMNSCAKKFIKKIRNKDVGYICTLGAYPDSDHADKVREKAKNIISQNNRFIGGFLCQGSVNPRLVEKMGKFPLNLIHPLTPERLKRIEDAKSHPDSEDLENGKKYFSEILK